jgi:hypothetical protein
VASKPIVKRLHIRTFSAAAPIKKPSLETALAMPTSPREMENESLVTLGAMGHYAARAEILRRHVMTIDLVDYDAAAAKVEEIATKNQQGMFLLSLPYQIGITAGITAGLASLPLVFHLPTAEWFNLYYVTTDVPEPADLETALEVGAWTWNWMEPPLGALSFLLLCMQYSRSQLENLGIKPYTYKIKEMRGQRLIQAFPNYDRDILMAYSTSTSIYTK